MKIPINVIPAKRRRHRSRRSVAGEAPPPPVAPLVLVGALYFDAPPMTLRLTFDREIDIANLAGDQIIVDDNPTGVQYIATGPAALLDPPTAVEVVLDPFDIAGGMGVLLDASASNGIVAVNDGGLWAGAYDLELPFP